MPSLPAKILLVDDEVDILEPLAFNLEASGFRVVTATSGNQAFSIFQQQPFDAIITDIKMPDGNGIELLKNVKEVAPLCPVVSFVTGYSDLTMREAYHLGVNSTFSKPFEFEKLKSKVVWALTPEEMRWQLPFPETPRWILKTTDLCQLGSGGVCLKLKSKPIAEIMLNEPFDFQFESPVGTIQGQGWVRWKDEPFGLVGIEFTFLAPECLPLVKNHIWNRQPKFYIPQN